MSTNNELENLKIQYQREKNLTVLIVCVVVFLCLVLSLLFLGVSAFFAKSDSSNSAQSAYQLACLPSGQKAISPKTITIRVLNGTGLSGLGTAVAQSLTTRGFANVPPESAPTTDDTEIHFGRNAVPQAYTLAGNFDSPVLILDDRKDGLIDVIVGRSFMDLQDRYLVTTMDPSQELKSPAKCVALADVKTVAAIKHDTELVPPYMTDEQLAMEGIVQDDMTAPSTSGATGADATEGTDVDPNTGLPIADPEAGVTPPE